MGLGNWIKSKREDLKQNIVQVVVDQAIAHVDAWGAKKWPVGWIRVRRAGIGWKTILGGVLAFAPEITTFTEHYAPTLVYALGMDDAQAQVLVAAIGKALFLIGVADKYIKFTRPIERRQNERLVTTESGNTVILAPVSSTQAAPTLILPPGVTKEGKVVFDSVFAAETKKGAPLEAAHNRAVEAVRKAKQGG